MSLQLYLAFVVACIALALLPGPVVTLIIANGLRHGTRAALINIAGVQAGLTIVITSADPDPTRRPPAYTSRYSSNASPSGNSRPIVRCLLISTADT